MEDKSGIVYILKNEAMPGYIKIGKAKDLKQTITCLDTSRDSPALRVFLRSTRNRCRICGVAPPFCFR